MQSIQISDITMKLADESQELSLSFKEKIELAKLLDRLNVSAIELSPIRNCKIDSLLVKSIALAVKHGTVAVPVTQEMESVERTWEALKQAKHPRLQLKAPMSAAQMEYFWHKKPAQMVDAIRALIAACREKCAEVEFIADDACRSEKEFLCEALKAAIEAGATHVTLCDAAGLMFPEEFAGFVRSIREEVSELSNVKLGVLCADSLSMSAPCAVAAMREGAVEVKTSVNQTGAASLTRVAEILKARGDEMGFSCDLRFVELKRITGQIEWMMSAGKTAPAMSASDASGEEGLVLSAHDDRAALTKAVEKIGYELSEEDMEKVYEAFQRIAARKGTISARELDTIVASAALQVPPTYRLVNYVINCGNVISASAQMKLKKGEDTLEGISIGDGPIDAAFLTIDQIVGHHYELDDFQIQAVTEGREAMGETVVRLRSNGKVYSGRGISTDIVGASIHAYLNAVNKIVYEEANA